jgi:uncharacterized membrane protein YhaH (DUF805 family)/FlaG/FlaF family flagellin (archaellin)
MMNMMDSVRICLRKYVDFEGRASRSEYWWFYLAYIIALFVAVIADAILFGIEMNDPTCFTWIMEIAMFLPILAVGIRRIHDHGMSGWYCLVPFYNLYLWIAEGESVPNMYGPVPTNIVKGKSGFQHVIVQQPMNQQYQQPMQQQYQQPMQQQYQQPMQQQYQQPMQQQYQQPIQQQYQQPMQQQYQQQPMQKPKGGPNTVFLVIFIIFILPAIAVILSGVLYVWAANLSEDNSDGSLSLYAFGAEDAYGDVTGGTDDNLVRVTMSQGGDINWASVLVKISVDNGVPVTCDNPGVTGGACGLVEFGATGDNFWSVGDGVTIVEGEQDLCTSGTCIIEVTITDTREGKTLDVTTAIAE